MGVSGYRSRWRNEDLEIFRDHVRKFFQQELVPHREAWSERGMVDREAWRKCGELGILCPSIPEAYGGSSATFAHEAVILEEEIATGAPSFGLGVHMSIVAHYVLAYGSEEQKKRWLPKMATGELIGAICMTEPNTGSDLQAITTTALREGDEYVVSGAKTFVTNGQHTNLICVVAKTDPGARARGISLIMVEAPAEGFHRGRNLKKLGLKCNDTSELSFDDVRVPAANLLGESEGRGFVQLMQQLPRERLAISVAAVASMERAVEITVQYVKEREAFGKPLFDLQNTRFKLAECATTAHIARTFLDDCIVAIDRGELSTERASMLKYWTTEQQGRVVDECVQLFGGYGYMLEYEIARLYADARVTRIFAGSNEIMKEVIGRSL
jgi:alkylation response protein AidB-like acyl-CoA dehydrogenase